LNKAEILALFEKMNHQNVLVVGDVMIDAYLWGSVSRISPEAPVPVIDISERENRLGGAANVALNLAALGAKSFICSVIGNDIGGSNFIHLMQENSLTTQGIVWSEERKTTVKTRIISQNQQMLRVDEEDKFPLSATEEKNLVEKVRQIVENHKIDVIIFEDYNKGVLSKGVIKNLISLANSKGIPTTVDPKKDNFFEYKNVSLFKPNLKELKEGLKKDIPKNNHDALSGAVKLLKEQINHKIALITLSEYGVFIEENGLNLSIPAHRRKIADVSGAGDTVISVASLLLALKVEPKNLAEIANLSGGLVCEEVGVVPINKDRLIKETLAVFNAD
jgi:rfaE bifunctional protein kinase chain/domain